MLRAMKSDRGRFDEAYGIRGAQKRIQWCEAMAAEAQRKAYWVFHGRRNRNVGERRVGRQL